MKRKTARRKWASLFVLVSVCSTAGCNRFIDAGFDGLTDVVSALVASVVFTVLPLEMAP